MMADNERDLRLFVAVELPSEVRAHLSATMQALSSLAAVRWVRPEGVHLTLKFLGNTPASLVPELGRGLGDVAKAQAPLRLASGQAGTFGGRNARVVWVGVDGELEQLAALARDVDEFVASRGFPRESREFRPHLTLGRLREDATPTQRQAARAAAGSLQLDAIEFEARELVLYRSELRSGGAVYTALHRAALGGADR
jgi:2'-5' RNA ligase